MLKRVKSKIRAPPLAARLLQHDLQSIDGRQSNPTKPRLPTGQTATRLLFRKHTRTPRAPPYSPPTMIKYSPKSWPCHFFAPVLSLLWLPTHHNPPRPKFHLTSSAPASVVRVGAAPPTLSTRAIATAVRLDERDHDVDAGLQYVAPAFERLFFMIATSFYTTLGCSLRGVPRSYR